MIRKILSLVAVAGLVCVTGLEANAAQRGAQRVTMYDAQDFVQQMDAAFNHGHPHHGLRFLHGHVTKGARFETRLVSQHAAQQHYAMTGSHWNNCGSYCRHYDGYGAARGFPHAYGGAPIVREVSAAFGGKSDLIDAYVNKRRRISAYHHQTILEGFSMEAGAVEGRAKVMIIERGGVSGQVYERSQCDMHLQKDKWGVRLSALSCQKLSPVL